MNSQQKSEQPDSAYKYNKQKIEETNHLLENIEERLSTFFSKQKERNSQKNSEEKQNKFKQQQYKNNLNEETFSNNGNYSNIKMKLLDQYERKLSTQTEEHFQNNINITSRGPLSKKDLLYSGNPVNGKTQQVNQYQQQLLQNQYVQSEYLQSENKRLMEEKVNLKLEYNQLLEEQKKVFKTEIEQLKEELQETQIRNQVEYAKFKELHNEQLENKDIIIIQKDQEISKLHRQMQRLECEHQLLKDKHLYLEKQQNQQILQSYSQTFSGCIPQHQVQKKPVKKHTNNASTPFNNNVQIIEQRKQIEQQIKKFSKNTIQKPQKVNDQTLPKRSNSQKAIKPSHLTNNTVNIANSTQSSANKYKKKEPKNNDLFEKYKQIQKKFSKQFGSYAQPSQNSSNINSSDENSSNSCELEEDVEQDESELIETQKNYDLPQDFQMQKQKSILKQQQLQLNNNKKLQKNTQNNKIKKKTRIVRSQTANTFSNNNNSNKKTNKKSFRVY